MTVDLISTIAASVYVSCFVGVYLTIQITCALTVLGIIAIIRKIRANRKYKRTFPIHVTNREKQNLRRTS